VLGTWDANVNGATLHVQCSMLMQKKRSRFISEHLIKVF